MVSSVNTHLESRIAKLAEADLTSFHKAIEKINGTPGGEVGSKGKSQMIKLLPKIPVQLIFYEGDEEFSSEVRLLFDRTAVNFLEFEFLAVMVKLKQPL